MTKRHADRATRCTKSPLPKPVLPDSSEEPSQDAAGFRIRSLVPSLSLTLFAIWMVAANFRAVITQDFWIHLRVGQDILANGQVPRADQYSAVAAGRPFIAHEWLSGVLFALLDRAAGGAVFSFLSAGIALACVTLLFLSLPKPLRAHVVTIPFLVLCAYAVDYRVTHRPHLFSLLLLCAVVVAMERWRRSRRLRDIVWLVPLHALWANLHGGYLSGIVLLSLLTVCTGIAILLARGAGDEAEQAYSLRDFGIIGAVALASFLASLLNPYGFALLETSFNVAQAPFLRQYVTEWHSPFLATSFFRANDPYVFWIYCAILFLLWGGIIPRVRRKPWIDAGLALAVTIQSGLANRFIADAAIVAFPIMVRSWTRLLDRAIAPRVLVRRPWLELALLIPLVGTTLVYGHAYGPTPERHRPIGIGYAPGKVPDEEMTFMLEHGYSGAIYNGKLEDGAAIMHRLSPQIRAVMDPRLDVYGEELFQEWDRSRSNKRLFDDYVRKYDVKLALLERDRALTRAVWNDRSWQPMFGSDRRLLFVRTR